MTIKGLFKSNKTRFILIILLLLLLAIFTTLSDYLFKPAIDNLAKGNLQLTLLFIGMMVLAQVLSSIFNAVAQTTYSRQTQDYIGLLRRKIIAHFYAKNDETLSEMENELSSNMDMLTENYASPFLTILSNSFTLILIIGVLIQLNGSILVLTAILAIINLLTPKILEKKTDLASKKVSLENNKLLKAVNNWLGGLQELRRYSSFSTLFRKMNEADRAFEDSNIKQRKVNAYSFFISNLVNTVSQVGLSLWAGVLFFQGKITIGAALVVGDFANEIFNSIWVYERAITQFKSVKSVNERTKSLEVLIEPQKHVLSDDLAELDIKNLSVQYDNGEQIIYPDIKIQHGEKILLSGDSGTGKSTLFKAILGQLKPKTGKIIFKDAKGKIIKPDLGKIGYIAQDSVLFPDSIKNNITMFNSKLDLKVPQIIEQVQLKRDLKKFPGGVNTFVNLDTDNLSGGQKQKVVLARCQIHTSQLILMDEATSSIDSEATGKIIQELLKSDATLILIAHNFSQKLRQMFDREIHLEGRKNHDI